MGTKELSIKLMIDTNAQKVSFVEASGEVVEFLAARLSLPLGTVTTLLPKERMSGSIGNVLGSMEKLDAALASSAEHNQPIIIDWYDIGATCASQLFLHLLYYSLHCKKPPL